MTNRGKIWMCIKRACHNIKHTNEISQRQRDVSERELIGEAQDFAVEGGADLALQETEVILCAGLTNICI